MSNVSIIIPAYNAERTLGLTLESVFSQTVPVAEVVVVDDGSNDDTARIARSFQSVRLIQQENAGPGAALNTGSAQAAGDIMIFLDSDDLLPADALSSHLAHLAAHEECDGAVGHMEEFVCPSERSEVARRFRPRERQPCWLAGGIALRSDAFRKVGPFDKQLRTGHWIDWMDRAKRAGLKFCVQEAIVLRRRLHTGSLSMRRDVSNGRGLILAARNALLRRRQETGPVMSGESEE